MRTHEQLIENGTVSVWVGDFESEDDLLCYVDDGAFSQDFDFALNPNGGRELVVEAGKSSIAKLIEGFSYWKNFETECLKAAKDQGIAHAKSMVVVYNFRFEATEKVNPQAPLRFMGSFRYSTRKQPNE